MNALAQRLLTVLCLIFISNVATGSPGLIHYQGRLTDQHGFPVNEPVTISFQFFDAPVGGKLLGDGYEDVKLIEPDQEGFYSTMIGTEPDNLVPESIFFEDAVYLHVNINGEDLLPRRRLGVVPYAYSGLRSRALVHRFIAAGNIEAGDLVIMNGEGQVRKAIFPGYDSRTPFTDAVTPPLHLSALNEHTAFIAYEEWVNNQYKSYGVIASVEDGKITLGPPSLLHDGRLYHLTPIRTLALSESKVLLVYNLLDGSSMARLASMSGINVTFHQPVSIDNGEYSISRVDENRAIAIHKSGGSLNAFVIDASSNVPTIGEPHNFVQDDIKAFSSEVSNGRVLVAYGRIAPGGSGIVQELYVGIVDVDEEDNISNGNFSYFSNFTGLIDIAPFLNTEWLVSAGGSLIKIMGVSDENEIFLPDYSYGSAGLSIQRHVTALTSSTAILADTTLGGRMVYAEFKDQVLHFSSEVRVDGAALIDTKAEDSFFAVSSKDGSGYVALIPVANIKDEDDLQNFVGVAESSASLGEECSVTLFGVTERFDSLQPGKTYYVTPDGLSLDPVHQLTVEAGKAIGPNQLLIK